MSETFLHKSGALQSADWVFICWVAGLPMTGRIRDIGQNVYNLRFKQEVAAAPLFLPYFLSYSIPRGGLY